MRGKPSPVEIKKLKATANKTRERRKDEPEFKQVEHAYQEKDELTLDQIIALAPDSLSPNGVKLWGKVAFQLYGVGLLFPSIEEYIEAYCKANDIRELAWKDVIRNGRYVVEGAKVIDDDDGNPIEMGGVKRISQDWKLYKEATDQMLMIGAKLGLSPVDKSKINRGDMNIRKDKNAQKRASLTA